MDPSIQKYYCITGTSLGQCFGSVFTDSGSGFRYFSESGARSRLLLIPSSGTLTWNFWFFSFLGGQFWPALIRIRNPDPQSGSSIRIQNQCCGSGSGIRDWVPSWPLDPGSGMGESQHPDPGSGIRDEQPGSYFLELRNHFFAFLGLKYLHSLMRIRDLGWRLFGSGIRDGKKSRIRDGKKSNPGSGINIPDPPHCPKHWSRHYWILLCNSTVYAIAGAQLGTHCLTRKKT